MWNIPKRGIETVNISNKQLIIAVNNSFYVSLTPGLLISVSLANSDTLSVILFSQPIGTTDTFVPEVSK